MATTSAKTQRTPPERAETATGKRKKLKSAEELDDTHKEASHQNTESNSESETDAFDQIPMGHRIGQISDSITKLCQNIEKECSKYRDGRYKFTMAEHGKVMAHLAGIMRWTMSLQKLEKQLNRIEEDNDVADKRVENPMGKDMDVIKSFMERMENGMLEMRGELHDIKNGRRMKERYVRNSDNDTSNSGLSENERAVGDVNVRTSGRLTMAEMVKKTRPVKAKQPATKKSARRVENEMTDDSETDFVEIRNKKTYARFKKSGNVNSSMKEVWKTPERKYKYERSVRLREDIEAVDVLSKVKSKLKTAKVGGLKGVWLVKNGRVVIEGNGEKQIKEVIAHLVSDAELIVGNNTQCNPKVIIRGAPKGITNEGVIEELVHGDHELIDLFGVDMLKKIKLLTRKQARNDRREHWVIEMPAPIFRVVMKKGFMVVDLVSLGVEEFLDVSTCYKCCRQGHVAKYCKQEAACSKCGGKHEGKDCDESQELNCINYERVGLNERRHGAFDRMCPVHIRAIERERERIKYD